MSDPSSSAANTERSAASTERSVANTERSFLLSVMRHAKSDWDDARLSDHDRPLNQRGYRDAPRMARWLADQRRVPEVIIGSTAVRVQQTIERMLPQWPHPPLVLLSPSLYLAPPRLLAEHVVSDALTADGLRPQRVLLIAHNPGVQQLTSAWAAVPLDMPTAAIATFQCEPLADDDLHAPRIRRWVDWITPKSLPA